MLLGSCRDFQDTLYSEGVRSHEPSRVGKLVPRCPPMLEGTSLVCALQALTGALCFVGDV